LKNATAPKIEQHVTTTTNILTNILLLITAFNDKLLGIIQPAWSRICAITIRCKPCPCHNTSEI